MEPQKRGLYLIKGSVAVQNVDWGGRSMCHRIYRQGTFHQWTSTFLYRQSTALRNLFNLGIRYHILIS